MKNAKKKNLPFVPQRDITSGQSSRRVKNRLRSFDELLAT
jgi:hypothetical protein